MNESQMRIRPGFVYTLLSLLLIGILAQVLFPAFSGRGRPKRPRALTDMRNLRAALIQYHAEFGEYPSGENSDILKILSGENSKKIKLFNVNPKSVNSRGEFLDPWKTPYEIKIVEQTNCTISSAGPNRVFGDKDDLTNSNP